MHVVKSAGYWPHACTVTTTFTISQSIYFGGHMINSLEFMIDQYTAIQVWIIF